MRRLKLWILLLSLGAVILTGCGSSKNASQSEMSQGGAVGAPAPSPAEKGADYSIADRVSGNSSAASAPSGKPATMAPSAPPSPFMPASEGYGTEAGPVSSPAQHVYNRKIILNAELNLRIEKSETVLNTISDAVRVSGGYVQDARQEGTRQQGRSISMVLRVPTSAYTSILTMVSDLGEVTSRREWTEDVTDQFFDLEARIKTKETHLEQLRKLYAKGGNIQELLELEREIARVTADLESMKGRINFLNSRIEFSTIHLKLFEPGAPGPIAPPKSAWDRITRGFVTSLNGVINFTIDVAVFVVSSLPVIIFFALLVTGLYVVLKPLGRRFRRPPSA